MKKLDAQTQCPCGEPLRFCIGKPTAITPAISKFICRKCDSIFLAKATIGLDRKVNLDIGVQELSPKCEAVLQKVIDENRSSNTENESGRAKQLL